MLPRDAPWWRKLKRRLSEILERGSVGDTPSRIVDRAIMALIVLNLVSITLQSVPTLSERYRVAFAGMEAVSLLVFTVEYALRIASPIAPPRAEPAPSTSSACLDWC